MIRFAFSYWFTFVAYFFAFVTPVSGQQLGHCPAVASVKLSTTESKEVNFKNSQGELMVFVFLSPECPISQQCTITIKTLVTVYGSHGVVFYGVVPGTMYSPEELKDFEKEYGLTFPLLADVDYKLTNALHASITPEVFVVSKDYVIEYSGAIDNAWLALGKRNAHTTAQYLSDALASLSAGEPLVVSSTRAVGCLIEGIKPEQKGGGK
jgi:peroxiredoxin